MAKTKKAATVEPVATFAAAALAANFKYFFERQGITILHFIVEGHKIDFPKDNGEFFEPILDPDPEKHARVIVVARQDLPAGHGSLSLKFNNKDVFDIAEEIFFHNGMGSINKLCKLP